MQSITDRSSSVDVILSIGDFNLPNLRWRFDDEINGFIPYNMSAEQERLLIESLFATGSRQASCFLNLNGRLLDLAFVNFPEQIDSVSPPTPLLPVDPHHVPFILLLDESIDVPISLDDLHDCSIFDYKACDFNVLNDTLLNINWISVLSNGTLDALLDTFYLRLFEVINVFVPKKKRASNPSFSKPWWTPELRNLRNILRKARSRFFLRAKTSAKSQLFGTRIVE